MSQQRGASATAALRETLLVTAWCVSKKLAPNMNSTDPASQRCALCGAQFHCAQQMGDAECWCASLPGLPADRLNPRMTCLCPDCLREETQPSINL
ncbi:cysteine-rich CWC family protein [Caballeronia mineralivorans]|jgi:hypothetical protein|uniref:cysteine-rich CWC family protein n=1 Tax=Caballeronia mineralivorans TaxID=2010198 RepID=UPI002AFE7EBF|nr:cysteine-rich CWC family protein [Caballeronia mineralivorans]